MEIIDADERAAALDPLRSFCVSAPAGSGKTELLIQRYLLLLARVSRPEQVLAITFTRKAAAEMRERVLQALQEALSGVPCDGPHQLVTRSLAQRVLAADEQAGWHLLRNIDRFNIKTIDSFCAGLARQMPILSELGGQVSTQDDVQELYLEAVAELFELVHTGHPVAADLGALMLHFDNNWERLQERLVTMLGCRDQWRAYIGVDQQPEESQAYLHSAIESLVAETLDELTHLLDPYQSELLELQQFAAENLGQAVPPAFPGSTPGDLPVWRAMASMLLIQKDTWRKNVTVREGFPSDKGEPEVYKNRCKDLLVQLRQIAGLQDKLAAVRSLPETESGGVSWQMALHLSRLLPVLAAQLLLVFQRRGVVDHSQVAEAALQALGDDDMPTDLALRLDYRIAHILVDEFQDTSINQFELLDKLTRGWGEHNVAQPENPRTLMIVGDGMQSIYAFRGANVGLLLKAQLQGFNGVPLSPLNLRCNFRSDEGIVNWVNDSFAQAFPGSDEINRAAVSYSPASAVRPTGRVPAVHSEVFTGAGARDAETAFICEEIAAYQAAGGAGTLAVLGRTRGHLQAIIQGLKARGVDYYAQDLDSLLTAPVVVDLMTICRLLANRSDHLAWLALLRAPWCGLELADLLALSQCLEEPRASSLWNVLRAQQQQNVLSAEGRARLGRIIGPLQQAEQDRDRLGLRVWIEQLWLNLDGPACTADENGLEDAESFLQLLEEADAQGIGLDLDWLERKLEQRYMSGGDPDSRVQLMTLHKAKGLEFDRVIMPQLDRIPRSDDRQILLWDEHSSAVGERVFLLAADDNDKKQADAPTLYNYLKKQRKQKAHLEATRLFYVGATRAISHLLLTASLKWNDDAEALAPPGATSLLQHIWPSLESQINLTRVADAVTPSRVVQSGVLRRLPTDYPGPGGLPVSPGAARSDANVPAFMDNHVDRSIGTVVHLALEQLDCPGQSPAAIEDSHRKFWRHALQRQGMFGDLLDDGVMRVEESVTKTLASEEGRWVLSREHRAIQREWPLTVVDAAGFTRDIVIDRCFIDAVSNVRWVVDYKNSVPGAGESLPDFFAREAEHYRDQLLQYRNALRGLGNEALRCALFFTALGQLVPLDDLDLPAREA